jgi:hypothetical protein
MPIIQDELNYKAPTLNPVTTEVDAGNETVEGRLTDLTRRGSSKYVDQARSNASRQANDRGLINSTMSAQAGEEAAIDRALPIAQQDADTYTKTRFKNQDIGNEFLKNRQNANLNKETASHGSGLARGEMTLGSELKTAEMGTASELQRGEMELGSELKKGEMTLGSALTNVENTLLNELTMKRDQGLSALTQEEVAQLKRLEMKRDAAQSELNKQEMELGSRLTNEEATVLNQLMMKRDDASSQLTREENTLLNQLEMKRRERIVCLKCPGITEGFQGGTVVGKTELVF